MNEEKPNKVAPKEPRKTPTESPMVNSVEIGSGSLVVVVAVVVVAVVVSSTAGRYICTMLDTGLGLLPSSTAFKAITYLVSVEKADDLILIFFEAPPSTGERSESTKSLAVISTLNFSLSKLTPERLPAVLEYLMM